MTEDTNFDFGSSASDNEQTGLMTPPPLPQQKEGKPADKKNVWKQVAVGAATGAGLGVGAIALTSFANPDTDDKSGLNSLIDDDMDVAKNVTEDMSFSEAFAAARAEVGPGGCFIWHGTIYGTYYANEWNSMSPAERAEFENHFSWGASTEHSATSHHSSNHTSTHAADSTHTSTSQSAHAQITTHQGGDYVSGENHGGNSTVQAGGGGMRVVSLGYDNDLNANVGIVEENGTRMMFVDVDNDQEFEYAVADINGNHQIEDNEVIDISDRHITMQTLQDLAMAQGDVVSDYDVAVVDDGMHQDYKSVDEHHDDNVIEAEVDHDATSTIEATPDQLASADVTIEAEVAPEVATYEATVETAEVEPTFDESTVDIAYDDASSYDDHSASDVDLV